MARADPLRPEIDLWVFMELRSQAGGRLQQAGQSLCLLPEILIPFPRIMGCPLSPLNNTLELQSHLEGNWLVFLPLPCSRRQVALA